MYNYKSFTVYNHKLSMRVCVCLRICLFRTENPKKCFEHRVLNWWSSILLSLLGLGLHGTGSGPEVSAAGLVLLGLVVFKIVAVGQSTSSWNSFGLQPVWKLWTGTPIPFLLPLILPLTVRGRESLNQQNI